MELAAIFYHHFLKFAMFSTRLNQLAAPVSLPRVLDMSQFFNILLNLEESLYQAHEIRFKIGLINKKSITHLGQFSKVLGQFCAIGP